MRQVSIALKNIDVRLYNKFASQANLMGAKIKMRPHGYESDSKEIEVTPEQEKLIQKALLEAKERKMSQRNSRGRS